MSESLDQQLGRFRGLHLSDPERARAVHALNEELVLLCKEGSLRRVKQLVEAAPAEDLMTYFVVRAFKAALLGLHLVLVDYLLSQGYPLNSTGVPYVLLEVIADMAGDPGQRDDSLAVILDFLLARSWNVNMQASKTWVSALHVSVQYSLLRSTEVLLAAGGDVNSVAAGDVMPLSVAEEAVLVLSGVAGKEERDEAEEAGGAMGGKSTREDVLSRAEAVRDLLLARGARITWRRDGQEDLAPAASGQHVFGSREESVGIRVGGGGSQKNGGGGMVRFSGGVGNVGATGGGGMVRFVGGPLALAEDGGGGVARLSSAVGQAAFITGSGSSPPTVGDAPSCSVAEDGAQLFSTGGN